jgi:ribosome modulation factor
MIEVDPHLMHIGYDEGYAAFIAFRSIEDNPWDYNFPPVLWQAWRDGWNDARRDLD